MRRFMPALLAAAMAMLMLLLAVAGLTHAAAVPAATQATTAAESSPSPAHTQSARSIPELGRLGAVAAAVAEAQAAAGDSTADSDVVSLPSGVLSVPISRNGGTNRKAVSKAKAGNPYYQRLLSVTGHAAQLQAERRQRLMAAGSPAPLSGCPFADFTIPVRMGGRSFELLADTGSSTLAVAGEACSNCAGVSPLWAASSSSVNQNAVARGSYGDQTGWTGAVWRDDVALGGANGAAITATAPQRIVVMTSQSTADTDSDGNAQSGAGPFFVPNPCSAAQQSGSEQIVSQGIIGLAYPQLAMENTDSFVFQLFDADPSLAREFSMQMCESSGNLWIGGSDPSAYEGEFQFTPIKRELYYDVEPWDVYVGSERMGFSANDWLPTTDSSTIVDSGTTMWELPEAVYRKVVDSLIAHPGFKRHFRAGAQDNIFDQSTGYCEAPTSGADWQTLQADLPTITLQMTNGLQLTMDGVGSYLIPCSNDYDQWTSGISGGDSMIGGWPLMNQFVVMHNLTDNTIGFAVQKTCATSKPTRNAKVSMGEENPGADGRGGAGAATRPVMLLVAAAIACAVLIMH